VLDLVGSIETARRTDSASPRIAQAQRYQRAGQFVVDFIEAENSMGFHADQEAARVLGNAINFARLGQAALRGEPVPAAPLDASRTSAHRGAR
jgi:nitrite reductase (cytochrome c-552)